MGIELHPIHPSLTGTRRYHRSVSQFVPSGANSAHCADHRLFTGVLHGRVSGSVRNYCEPLVRLPQLTRQLRRDVFTSMFGEPAYFADASQSRAAPRKITPASSLKAAVLHHVLLSFMSDARFSVIW
jgi:hypothetical protein